MLLEVDPPERVVSERARFADVAVDPVDVGITLPAFPQRERPHQVVADRGCEPTDLVAREIGRELEW